MNTPAVELVRKTIIGYSSSRIYGKKPLQLSPDVVDKIKDEQRHYRTLLHTIGLEKKPTILGMPFEINHNVGRMQAFF